MKLTDKEARQKLCHQVLAQEKAYTCCESFCMAWRWDPMPSNKLRRVDYDCRMALKEPVRPKDLSADWIFVPYDRIEETWAHWLEPDEQAEARRTGYCGLAGEVDYA